MSFHIISDDITTLSCDAIVNAANSRLQAGGGVCGAIFDAAGYDKLTEACQKIGHCDEGDAVITPGFALPAKYIIHTFGPIYQGGSHGEARTLASCYRSSLELAARYSLKSIAFPLISSGIFGYPRGEAMQIATVAINEFLSDHELDVYLIDFRG